MGLLPLPISAGSAQVANTVHVSNCGAEGEAQAGVLVRVLWR